jgi:hypothetical protein
MVLANRLIRLILFDFQDYFKALIRWCALRDLHNTHHFLSFISFLVKFRSLCFHFWCRYFHYFQGELYLEQSNRQKNSQLSQYPRLFDFFQFGDLLFLQVQDMFSIFHKMLFDNCPFLVAMSALLLLSVAHLR